VTTTQAPVFEPGALVTARGREWVVLPQSEPPGFLVLRPLGGGDDEAAAVFPSLEQVTPATFPPPEPSDAGTAASAGLLRAALRIGFRASGGPFRSLARLAVEPRAYQLVPLLLALRQDTVRLLIADDVGIGKTIEAGLIAAELLEQGDAKGLAVLCGPALAEQWQGELAEKFAIHAELVLPGTIRRLERGLLQGETLFDRHRHLVISTDFIKRPGLREQFWLGCPDLLIIDEAHTCVTDGTGGRSRMLRHELVTRLAKGQRRHLILVTATPHSGKDEGFRNLLALVGDGLQHADLDSPNGREHLARHFVQRRRADIRSYLDQSTPFPEDRLTKEHPYTYPPAHAYKDLFDDVLAYARERVRDPEGGQIRQRVRYWSALALLRALASSPRAAAATLHTRATNLEAEDAAEADRLGRSAVLDQPDEETIESADATPGADAESETGETPERRRLRRFAARAAALEGEADVKLAAATEIVKELLLNGFNPVVFCRFIDTAEYVSEHLARQLGHGYTVAAVTGTLPPEERQARITDLTNDLGHRPVLVATDCLSEGVNLQERFQAVVHYDLAWNPTRHEQREGRVDRFGQRARTVRAVMLYGTNNGVDGIVLNVLLRKHEQIRKALGVSVPVPDRSDDVVQAILEGLLLRDTGEQLALDLGSFGQERRETLHREWDSAATRERQSRTKYAQAGIQPAQVAQELAEIRASVGDPTEVASFTEEALKALRTDVFTTEDGFRAAAVPLPTGLRDTLTPRGGTTLTFHRDLPVPPGESCLNRTDPNVTAIARHVLESALDPSLPAEVRPARRCGVMRTTAVTRRTTLLLARVRLHVELPGRDEPRQVVAEEARLLAYRGRAEDAEWLTSEEAQRLASARPTGNIPSDQAIDFAEQAIVGLPAVTPRLNEAADELAAALRESHIRVREAAGQHARRQIAVRSEKPVDILGVYVYLPTPAGAS
jgi:superfamily II DNA/RNA helicase